MESPRSLSKRRNSTSRKNSTCSFNRNQNSLNRKNSSSPFEATNTWYINLCSFTISLLLYYLFSTFTSNIYYYESTECVFLLKHCQSIANLYYYYAVITGIFFLTSLIGFDLSGLKLVLQFCVTIITAVYLVLVTGDLLKGEKCGELQILSLVWVIYGWIEVTCLCCMCCCVTCALGAGIALASTRRE